MAVGDRRLLAGRYRVVRRLGAGGVGGVYQAEDERLGRTVAIKRLHAERAEEMARRFQREAQLGASLNHRNLVTVYDAVPDEEGVLLVMEYVEGPTLAQRLARGRLDREEAVEVLRGMAAALDHAHRHGIVHRDVKPANVLLGAAGVVKVADLGIASAVEGTQITRTGTLLGTAAYMAPEQLVGGRTSPATDVYALAAVAFEVLSGERARPGRTPMEIAHRAATEPPPQLRSAWPEAPVRAAEALRRGMARDPGERPGSAGALIGELAEGLAPPETPVAASRAPTGDDVEASRPQIGPAPAHAPPDSAHAPPDRAPPPPDRSLPSRRTAPAHAPGRRAVALAGALFLALLVVAAFVWTSGQEAGRPTEAPAPRGSQAPEAARPPSRSPEATVRDFYALAAADRYREAWALAGKGWRQQLGGYQSFSSGELSELESISFASLETTSESGDSAEVSARTAVRLSSGTRTCRSTFRLARTGGRWRIEAGSVRCQPGEG